MIENREETVLAMDRIYFESPDAWEEDLFDTTEYAMNLDKRNPVLEGVIKHLGLAADIEDEAVVKAATKELNRRYRELGIEEGTPKAVKNWLKGTPVNPAYRENLYNLCLAMGLGLQETIEFFLKNYMTIPFNYKDRIDAIYYFGFAHDLKYAEIKELIDDTENIGDLSSNRDERTAEIGAYIADIDDVSKLKEFLLNHTYSRESQYNSAATEIDKLVDANTKLAEIERRLKPNFIKLSDINEERLSKGNKNRDDYERKLDKNMSGLLFVIYGFDSQKEYADHRPGISKATCLPKRFRENFPNDVEFSRISNRSASPDVYRKALIIMKFYNFFCSNMLLSVYGTIFPDENANKKITFEEYYERAPEDIEEDLNDFYYETSKMLAACGFEQMYARNPFDWLILYCAKSTDPLETFRDLLDQRYMDKDE